MDKLDRKQKHQAEKPARKSKQKNQTEKSDGKSRGKNKTEIPDRIREKPERRTELALALTNHSTKKKGENVDNNKIHKISQREEVRAIAKRFKSYPFLGFPSRVSIAIV